MSEDDTCLHCEAKLTIDNDDCDTGMCDECFQEWWNGYNNIEEIK